MSAGKYSMVILMIMLKGMAIREWTYYVEIYICSVIVMTEIFPIITKETVWMFDKLTNRLGLREKALDAAWVRNEVISQNIANVDTPGYKKSSVTFEEYLESAGQKNGFKGNTTDSRHIRIGKDSNNARIRVTKDHKNLSNRLDGNNVDIEVEMAEMAKNDIRYSTLVQSISGAYQRIRSVINEGRR